MTQADELDGAAERVTPPGKRPGRSLGVRIALFALAALVAVGLFLVGVFAGDRWLRNDAADFQGTWYVAGTAVPVVFDGGSIRLSDDVSYAYDIDATAKTIRYQMAGYSGQGRYWFSPDRSYLFVEDGAFDAFDTLAADVGRIPAEMSASLAGADALLPEGGDCIALSRVAQVRDDADSSAAAPSEPVEPADVAEELGEEPGEESVEESGGKISDEVFAEVGDR